MCTFCMGNVNKRRVITHIRKSLTMKYANCLALVSLYFVRLGHQLLLQSRDIFIHIRLVISLSYNNNIITIRCVIAFASLKYLWDLQKCGWRRSLFHILNDCTQICSPTGLCHGPWSSRVVCSVWPLLASKSSTRRLSMDCNASVSIRQIIHTPHANILNANIRYWPKQQ